MLRFLLVSVRCLDARLIIGDAHGRPERRDFTSRELGQEEQFASPPICELRETLRSRSRQQVAKAHGRGTGATANHREGITVSDLPPAFD